ncbi:hypothetical protein [Arthrobacter sp. ISL-5]|uniref:hypothetical protein n=1 Tax=Arthrobacter sp. ISL-5 TaxID=2819111 RepID=UPI001BEADFE9|nr:hypothetical protein [Arthrobacter sp. ISL-5]MBT2555313.1 hypothetical protein [Arthrobacter sp. ISL-5]
MKSQAPAAEAPPPEATGTTAVRLFAGFAGFGAASVNLAVSSSLFAAAGTGHPRLTPLALAAALWGATLLAWTVAALRNGNFPMPRTSATALPAAAAVHVLDIVTGARGDSPGLGLSHLAALLLTLMIIAAKAWLGRQPSSDNDGGSAGGGTAGGGGGSDDGGRPAPGGTGAARLLAAAFAGALAVAAITTPGLAASTAGQFAVPHGSHSGGAAGHHGP